MREWLCRRVLWGKLDGARQGWCWGGGGCGCGLGLFYGSGWGVERCGFRRVVMCLLILAEFKWDGESIELGNACGVGDL